MTKKTKLELTWIGKDERPRLEPRILLEDPEGSHHAKERRTGTDQFDNRLIFGDNLLALKALEAEFAGKVKCVYIDPPYNTGAAFTHYQDGLQHSTWLSLVRDRVELLRTLLANDGVLFSSIDDSEFAYLTVLLDEVFGRKNACGPFVWEKKKKPSFLNASMGIVTEYIVAYAKDRAAAPAFIGGVTTEGKKYPLNNAGNGIKVLEFPAMSVEFSCADQTFLPQDMSEGNVITRLLDRVDVCNGRNVRAFRLEGEWRYSQAKVDEIVGEQERLVISKAPFRPNHIKDGGDPKKLKNLLTVAHYQMSTYEDATAESCALFGSNNMFDYPKPEKLIQTLINAVTKPGDWVLDSFAGSGTTGAVAQKMGRRWIMIEQGEHCHTHIIPRLTKVIDGEDPGGVTEATGWMGGGGFRYFKLAPSLLEKDRYGQWVISKDYNAAMLSEAVCKLHNFKYEPSDSVYWQQGRSSERDFIYVTTQTLSADHLQALSDEVGTDRTLLVLCSAFRCADPEQWLNLTVKKIPKSVLDRCEWGRDSYSLAITDLPQAPPERPGSSASSKSKRASEKSEPSLFDAPAEREGAAE